jgi:hypothetical protein
MSPPLRRRYSATSLSPHSSPSHRSPPRKRLEVEFKPTFDVRPKDWKGNDDLLFDGLFDSVYSLWLQNSRDVLHLAFRHDSWSSKFIDLGFSLSVISLIQKVLDELEACYSSAMVWNVLQLETVGTVATLVLWAEVMHHSHKFIEYGKTKDADGDKIDEVESSNGREDTPCPIQTMSNTISSGNDDADLGGGEPVEDEKGCGGGPGEDDGNRGTEGYGGEGKDGGNGGAGGDGGEGEDGGKSNEDGEGESDSDDDDASDTTKRFVFLRKIDQSAKDLGIVIHFLGNSGIEHDPSFIPSFNILPEPASESNILFHGSGIVNGPARLFSKLSSFLSYGPIIMEGDIPTLKSSYLSTLPAVYYSSSLTYARLWPILKLGLSQYRLIDPIPQEVSLIAISRVSGTVLNGEVPSVKTARISQDNRGLAAKASSSNYMSLTFD